MFVHNRIFAIADIINFSRDSGESSYYASIASTVVSAESLAYAGVSVPKARFLRRNS